MSPEAFLIAGVLLFFATTALNRFIGERNFKRLAHNEKLKLIDAFSTHRSLATYVPIVVLVGVIVVGWSEPQRFVVAFPVAVLLVLGFSLSIQVAIFRRLSTLKLPDEFIRTFRVQSTLVQLGNLVALSLFTLGVVAHLT